VTTTTITTSGLPHFQRVDHTRLVAGLTRRLHHLGYEVILRLAA
jgi:hypothetical protein